MAIRIPQPEGWGALFRYRRDTLGLDVPIDLRERFLIVRGGAERPQHDRLGKASESSDEPSTGIV